MCICHFLNLLSMEMHWQPWYFFATTNSPNSSPVQPWFTSGRNSLNFDKKNLVEYRIHFPNHFILEFSWLVISYQPVISFKQLTTSSNKSFFFTNIPLHLATAPDYAHLYSWGTQYTPALASHDSSFHVISLVPNAK